MAGRRHNGTKESLTIVIKLGTSSIVSESSLQPRLGLLSNLVEACVSLRSAGHRIILVSSGAIGMGMRRMSLHEGGLDGRYGKRPKSLAEKQALAAIGQGHLIALWDNLFSQLNQPIAQILLTRNDLADRSRYLNATSTLSALLSAGVIPIINENDSVAVSEIKFGDNDTLSAVAAGMCSANYLFLLTDVDCLYTKNPRVHPDAQPVMVVKDIEGLRSVISTNTSGSSLGTGGMATKLIAAELATGAGVATVICHGSKPHDILTIASSELSYQDSSEPAVLGSPSITDEALRSKPFQPLHTLFLPRSVPLSDRKFWIAHGLAPRGDIVIDAGAYRAMGREGGGRLLPAGVLRVTGNFMAGEAVRVWVARHSSRGPNGETSYEQPRQPSSRGASRAPTPLEDRSPAASIADTGATRTPRAASSHGRAQTESVGDTSGSLRGDDLQEVGRGLANYHAVEIDRIKGLKSSQIESVLGHIDSEHVVDGIALLHNPRV